MIEEQSLSYGDTSTKNKLASLRKSVPSSEALACLIYDYGNISASDFETKYPAMADYVESCMSRGNSCVEAVVLSLIGIAEGVVQTQDTPND